MTGLTTTQPIPPYEPKPTAPRKASEYELQVLHRAMDPEGGLILVPLRASVIEWVIPEDETGEQMTYFEVARAFEQQTGNPFDPQLITDAEIHEALVSEGNALADDLMGFENA